MRSTGELPGGTVTFLFTDVEGSTPLLARLGSGYQTVLAAHDSIIRRALVEWRGVEVKTEGDSFFAVFAEAADAVSATVQAQLELSSHRWPEDAGLRVRMGLHTGHAQPVDGDYIAIAVNLAARVSAAAHGGQVVMTAETAAAAGPVADVRLVSLGKFRFKGFEEPVEVLDVRHPHLDVVSTALRAAPASNHNFRVERTSFLGRLEELETVAELATTGQLLTLTGPGGAGKTRLAKEVGLRVASEFRDGAWFVDLAPLPRDGDVASAVGRVLGIRSEPTSDPTPVIAESIGGQRVLLVLDNCEHVLDAAAALADELLGVCPQLGILATSQERLAIQGETVWPVPSLRVEDAVDLLEQRARAARPDLRFDESDREAIAAICSRLDGLPLAVELAAVRIVGGMRPAQVLERLHERFALLEGGSRSSRAAHRTLRSVVEWAYELLSASEQAVLRRASAFAGSFSLEAAEAVCSDEAIPIGTVARHLGVLVDKSLLTADGEGRFRLLESIRSFGLLQLDAGEERVHVVDRHLGWIGRVVVRRDDETDETDYLNRVEAEYDELRLAMDRVVETGAPTAALQACVDAGRLLAQRHHHVDGSRWLRHLLDHADDAPTALRARGFARLGALRYPLGDLPAAAEAFELAMDLAAGTDDRDVVSEILLGIGNVACSAADYDAGIEAWERALPLVESEALSERRWIILNNLAYAHLVLGSVPESRRWYDRLAEDGGTQPMVRSMVHSGLTEIALVSGDDELFRREAAASLTINDEIEEVGDLASAMNAVAAWSGPGRERSGAQLLGAARALLDDRGFASYENWDERERHARKRFVEALGPDAFATAWTAGAAMTRADAIALARSLLT